MVTIKVQAVCHDDAKHADFAISITSAGGAAGIESVVVTALDGSVVNKQTPQACPLDLQFSVGAAYSALPVYVAVTECQSGVDQGQATKIKTSAGPFGKECLRLVDCKAPGQNQNNQACVTLQKAITMKRNKILTDCATAKAIQTDRDQLLLVAAALLAASVASAAVAAGFAAAAAATGLLPWVAAALTAIAIAFGVQAAILLGAANIAFGIAVVDWINLGAVQGQMANERQDLSDLVSRLDDVCCTEFINVPRDLAFCP